MEGEVVKIWHGPANWFWMVRDPRRRAHAIGVAPTRAEALSSARGALEELREVSEESDDCSAEISTDVKCWRDAERRRWAAMMTMLDRFLTDPPLYAAITLS